MKDAYLLLGDGQIFKGKRIGSERDAVGELVFTTAMVGCNKTLSDPNYYGQLLLFTFPAVGNCGLITADFESGGVHAFGVVVRELCGAPSNFRSEGTLGDYLQKADVPGICGVDTRRLTAILRDKGTMNACICADPTAVDMDALNGYAVGDAVARVSVKEKTHYETPDARCRVSLLDYGTSAELLAELQSRGCAVTVYPQHRPAEAIVADRPEGVLLGDGPGDPKISPQRIETVRALCGKTPLFAVGLGHELLALAAQLCTKPTLIPQALLHYERGICAEDAFSAHGKRAFIMSHVLDMTGAPIVLVSAVPVLRSMGYEVLVLGPSDGGSLHLFLDAGASVITRSSCRNVSVAWGMALCADFVIANTVVMARAVRALSGTAVPVLWWLHDAFAGYPHIAHQIPTQLGENVRVYSVGSHAANAMHAVRPEFEIRPLIYGLPDYAAENFVCTDLGYNRGRPLFATVGSFERRKGHDIFCKAIRLLPPEVREKASFLFVGQAADKEMMDSVRALTADYPENVYYCKRLTRDEIKSLMEQCTGLVCASRDDPMPTFVTEGLIFGKPSIVSEHTGTAGLISEGRNGFVSHNDDPQQLAVLLEHAIEHPEELASMRTECRKMYEQYYSKEAFEQTLRAAVEDLTAKK